MEFDAEHRRKALDARRAKVAAGAHFRRNWLDSGLWDELAKKAGIRLPQWHVPPTGHALKKWHRILDKEPFEAVFGCQPKRLMALNPGHPLRAFVGQMLERR